MKDKKTIWHEPTERPDAKIIVIIIDGKPLFGQYFQDEYGNEFVLGQAHWHDVEKWCYLDDLLSLSDRVDELEKALSDIEINHNITDCCQSCGRECEVCKQNREIARKALQSIDTITKDTKRESDESR